MTRYLLAGATGGALALALWVLWLTAETEEEADGLDAAWNRGEVIRVVLHAHP